MQIDKGRIVQEIVARLSKLKDGEGLLLQPYKKDRSVYVIRRGSCCRVLERGFVRKECVLEMNKVRKLLKTVCKREFPRSNKIWLKLCAAEEVESLLEK